MSKKKSRWSISFVGGNSSGVTGSMTLVSDGSLNILLEAGLYQSGNPLKDYRENARRFDFSPSKIDYIFLCHVHADHSMLIPRLYAEGCKAKIIVPVGTKQFFHHLGIDSAYIVERDCYSLEQRYKRSFHRIYRESDVLAAEAMMNCYPAGVVFDLDDRVSFRFTPSGHIVGAMQLELWLKDATCMRRTKLLYTSDLGNLEVRKFYASSFEPVQKADIVIGECTYGAAERIKHTSHEHELQRLASIIATTPNVVEIPVFALDRCPNVLTELYLLYKGDSSFTRDIVVDSPLAVKMLGAYLSYLTESGHPDAELFREVLSWGNLRLISDVKESTAYMRSCKNPVVLSCSGMLCCGRSRQWLKRVLPDSDSTIVFVGFAVEGTLAYDIKQGKKKYITVDGQDLRNNCRLMVLNSFTSHMQYADLMNYYSSIQANKICLVHGDSGKAEFAQALQERILQNGSATRVISVTHNQKLEVA